MFIRNDYMTRWMLGKDSHEFYNSGKLVISDRGI